MNRLPLPAEEHDGPARWERQDEDVEFEILTDIVEKLEKECAADGVATIAEKDGDPEAKIEKDGSSGISVARGDRIGGVGGVDCRDGNTLFALRPFARSR
jgi:hypothetical protein